LKILLIRTSALGDIVHCLPVLTALRRRFPAARLGWIVEEVFAPLLEGHADLDEIVPVATRRWRRQPLGAATRREVVAFRRRLRAFDADLVLDLMGNHKAAVIARLAGSPRRLGPRRTDRKEPSSAIWLTEQLAVEGVHAVDRGLDLLVALDARPDTPDFGAGSLLPKVPPDAAAPSLQVHPGAAWGNKRYPPTYWGDVLRRLHRATGLEAGVLAGPGEEELARAVVEASGGVARLHGSPGLPALVASLRSARLVLGGDTGPVHLAHALGVGVLAVMGPTDPRLHGPYGHDERALALRLPCSYCYRRYDEAKACLLGIPSAAVAERALTLLA
jgi:heptosyltransferase-1